METEQKPINYARFAGALTAELQCFSDSCNTALQKHFAYYDICKIRDVLRKEAEAAIKRAEETARS